MSDIQNKSPRFSYTHPLFLLMSTCAAVLILLGIFLSAIIRLDIDLSDPQMNSLRILGLALLLYALGSLIYGIITWRQERQTAVWAGLTIAVAQLLFLSIGFTVLQQYAGWFQSPAWMNPSESILIYYLAFLMPGFLYGLGFSVIWLTPSTKKISLLWNGVVTVVIPLGAFLFIKLLIPVLDNAIVGESLITLEQFRLAGYSLAVVAVVSFLFFLVRTMLLALRKRPGIVTIFKLPVVLAFPLIGLFLNNSRMAPFNDYVFGNFSHPLFYILAVVTGILLVVSFNTRKLLHQIQVCLLLLTFPYTLYFFIVFLPWIPVAVPLVLFFGTGMLMLAPLGLMVFHIRFLWENWPKVTANRTHALLLSLLLIMLLPAVILVHFQLDRRALNKALDYIYQPDYTKLPAPPSSLRLTRVLNRPDSGRSWFFQPGNITPILTPLYNRVVFGQQVLSESRHSLLRAVFTGQGQGMQFTNQPVLTPRHAVSIVHSATATEWDPELQLWRTTLRLWIKNHTRSQMEYQTGLVLPSGMLLSGLRLRIGDVLKNGLLAEKKSAVWIYDVITAPRVLDPAIVYYLNKDTLQMKVFPFAPLETRYLEMDITHERSGSLQLAGQTFNLPATHSPVPGRLPIRKALPRYYVIIDSRLSAAPQGGQWPENSPELLSRLGLDTANTIYYTGTLAFHEVRPQQGKLSLSPGQHSRQGGFYPDILIRKILVDHYRQADQTVPVFILCTGDTADVLFSHNLYDYAALVEGTPGLYFYHPQKGLMQSHWQQQARFVPVKQLSTGPLLITPSEDTIQDFRSTWLSVRNDFISKPWAQWVGNKKDFTDIQAGHLLYLLEPQRGDALFRKLTALSFKSGWMLPLTSYIVLETEQQEKALLEKQRQVLSGKSSLDAGQELRRMSEPPEWLWLLIITVFALVYSRRRQRSRKGC